MNRKQNKKVILISTGGTIASKVNPETGLLTAGLMTGEELSSMCDLPSSINVEVLSLFQIPSNRMTFNNLEILKEKIEELFENKNIDGIVVTHGTDTLEETAYFLDLTIADSRPVVITGSQRGPTVLGTDALVNLRQSILLAANDEAANNGLLVLFNERIYSAKYIKKQHASNVDGFTSFGFGYLGIIDQNTVRFYQRPLKRETFQMETNLPEVEIVKCSLGSSGHFIRHATDIGIKGIVIEAPGRGHAPPSIMESVKYAIAKGVKIVLTTSAEEGEVKVVYDFPGSAYDMKNSGVILGNDYDSKKARIKLAVLLASNQKNIDKYF